MKTAVLSDIHGNYHAFKSCIDYALEAGCDSFFLLGDYLGEFAYPERTMELLYNLRGKYPCRFIRGNKENYWLDYKAGDKNNWKDYNSTTGSLAYTYSHITDDDLKFFESLSMCDDIEFDGFMPMTLCHASPVNISRKLLPDDEESRTAMERNSTDIIFCGHSHLQKKITYGRVTAYDAGAVGVPVGSNGKAQFLIIESDGKNLDISPVSIDYDRKKTLEELSEEHLDEHAPYWTKITRQLIMHGRVMHSTVVSRAMEICRIENGKCIWPEIPEACWKKAYEEFF